MQIWRMDANGSNQQQITFDKYNDWFPHPSPNGKWVVFLSYIDKVDPGSHPPFKQVMLRMINTDGGEPIVLTKFFGGQGTINVPSWSPGSERIAFVSYELVE
jgi:Tol biopolymer transport system component